MRTDRGKERKRENNEGEGEQEKRWRCHRGRRRVHRGEGVVAGLERLSNISERFAREELLITIESDNVVSRRFGDRRTNIYWKVLEEGATTKTTTRTTTMTRSNGSRSSSNRRRRRRRRKYGEAIEEVYPKYAAHTCRSLDLV